MLVDVDGEQRLLGSRCVDCGAVTFPAQGSCPRCAGTEVEPRPLARHGALWSYTIQSFRPKTPYVGAEQPFTPYGVGYVDLGGEVLVEARLVADDLGSLRIGDEMELVLETLVRGADGVDIRTFAFAPVPAHETQGASS